VHAALVSLADGEEEPGASDIARRALVEVLRHGDRRALVRELDRSLLGARTNDTAESAAPDARC
jgi:hypothetical protein